METNHSRLLQILTGEGGDYQIGTTAITDKKFSRIVITAEATLTALKIRGIDVRTVRNYGTLPVGYVLVAGGDDFFDHVDFATGSAEGYLYSEPSEISFSDVAVPDGEAEAALTATITYSNSGAAASKKVLWNLLNPDGDIVDSGEEVLYFLPADNGTITIAGLTYPADAADGYEFDVMLDGEYSWTTSALFEITEPA